jgi:UDP-hydrolysing UDP-N-acetyl-D-glucosamine 2-epimerase
VLPDLPELEQAVGLRLGGYFLVTYHPVTLAADSGLTGLRAMLSAFDEFPDVAVVITGVNADPGHSAIAGEIADYAAARSDRVRVVASLGQRRYFGAMRHCLAVVGNSSSGLLEAPALKVPTVNIGDRHRGRIRAASVIDCGETAEAVAAALRKAMSLQFRAQLVNMKMPYGTGGAARRMVEVLKSYPLDDILLKRFHDMPAEVPTWKTAGIEVVRT